MLLMVKNGLPELPENCVTNEHRRVLPDFFALRFRRS